MISREGEPQYNDPAYDRLWAAIQDTGMPLCMHVATGKDPRTTRGPGGAIVNKAVGAFASQVMEALALLLASGVFERFPKLRFITVEADIGWIPWFLEALDNAYYRHHMWVRPWLNEPPSHYYHTNCFSTFMEDTVGVGLIKRHNLIDNVFWTNDYPHQEGSWPHSAEAIERQLQDFSETERAKILGLNAARVFGFTTESRVNASII
jgi:predicted TIM-barrel fold metal-dependent hydrolase